MKQTILIGVLFSIILILSFLLFTQRQTNSPTPSQTSNETNTKALAEDEDATAKPMSQSEYIKLISPNGGETFKIGSPMPISWEANNLPADSKLEVELGTISGDTTILTNEGVCTNCTFETRGGIPFYAVTNGAGSTAWTAGELYRGGFVEPGNNYIFKVTVSKTGFESEGDCPLGAFKGMCEVIYEIDWSDAPFTLIK